MAEALEFSLLEILDDVEKLQNYDWVVADLNIFDVIPEIESTDKKRNIETIKKIFFELTRLTQEHYIFGDILIHL